MATYEKRGLIPTKVKDNNAPKKAPKVPRYTDPMPTRDELKKANPKKQGVKRYA